MISAGETFKSDESVIYWNEDMPSEIECYEIEDKELQELKYQINYNYKAKFITRKSFIPQLEYTNWYLQIQLDFYDRDDLRKNALNYLLNKNKWAMDLIKEMQTWKKKLYFVYIKNISDEELIENVKTICDSSNIRWVKYDYFHPRRLIDEGPELYKKTVGWKFRSPKIIDTHVLVKYQEDLIYEYLNQYYYKTAIVISDVPFNKIEDERLRNVKFTFLEFVK